MRLHGGRFCGVLGGAVNRLSLVLCRPGGPSTRFRLSHANDQVPGRAGWQSDRLCDRAFPDPRQPFAGRCADRVRGQTRVHHDLPLRTSAREFWQAGRLVRLDSVTNDDGDAQSVRVRQNGSGLDVQDRSAVHRLPDALPSSYWHPGFRGQQHDRQPEGPVDRVTIDDLGAQKIGVAGNQSIDANRYAMRGDIDLEFWYDRDRRWRKMEFTIAGGRMEYFDIRPEPRTRRFSTTATTGVTLPAVKPDP